MAFTELVRRYVNLVYSAAARRVGDRHLAQDVTQAVFVILAGKAKSLRRDTPISGWLLTTVRYAAANALKIERRRRRHERAMFEREVSMLGAGACSSNPANVLVWQEVAAQLDDAVMKLPESDRRAILLRYFENRPIGEIAANLNATEGAIKQRLGRAVEKLKHRLERRGVEFTSLSAGGAGLIALLDANAVQAAPGGLIISSCAAASGVAGAGMGITIAKGALTMMTWTKTKIAASIVAAALVGGAGGIWTINQTHAQDSEKTTAAPATAPQKKPPRKGMTVTKSPPVIVSTTPRAGDTKVDPSITELKITFSKDMEDGSWSWAQMSDDTFPETTGKPYYEDDARTCVLPVKLKPGQTYVLLLNKPPFNSFVDDAGRKALEYWLVFETRE